MTKPLRITLEQAKDVVNHLPDEFSTKEFIDKFSVDYEDDYVISLFNSLGLEPSAVHKVDKDLVLYMSEHKDELNIEFKEARDVDVERKYADIIWRKK